MYVGNAIVVVFSEERSHRDDIFRIVVFDEAQVSEFTFSGGIIGYDRVIDVYLVFTRIVFFQSYLG